MKCCSSSVPICWYSCAQVDTSFAIVCMCVRVRLDRLPCVWRYGICAGHRCELSLSHVWQAVMRCCCLIGLYLLWRNVQWQGTLNVLSSTEQLWAELPICQVALLELLISTTWGVCSKNQTVNIAPSPHPALSVSGYISVHRPSSLLKQLLMNPETLQVALNWCTLKTKQPMQSITLSSRISRSICLETYSVQTWGPSSNMVHNHKCQCAKSHVNGNSYTCSKIMRVPCSCVIVCQNAKAGIYIYIYVLVGIGLAFSDSTQL